MPARPTNDETPQTRLSKNVRTFGPNLGRCWFLSAGGLGTLVLAVGLAIQDGPGNPLFLICLIFGIVIAIAATGSWRQRIVLDDEGISIFGLGGERQRLEFRRLESFDFTIEEQNLVKHDRFRLFDKKGVEAAAFGDLQCPGEMIVALRLRLRELGRKD